MAKKKINTYQELIALIEKLSPLCQGKVTLDNLTWFCAYQDADEMDEMSTKDLARLLQKGFSGYKTFEDVDEWLKETRLTKSMLINILIEFGYTPEYNPEQYAKKP
jgi:hypothetical protein